MGSVHSFALPLPLSLSLPTLLAAVSPAFGKGGHDGGGRLGSGSRNLDHDPFLSRSHLSLCSNWTSTGEVMIGVGRPPPVLVSPPSPSFPGVCVWQGRVEGTPLATLLPDRRGFGPFNSFFFFSFVLAAN